MAANDTPPDNRPARGLVCPTGQVQKGNSRERAKWCGSQHPTKDVTGNDGGTDLFSGRDFCIPGDGADMATF